MDVQPPVGRGALGIGFVMRSWLPNLRWTTDMLRIAVATSLPRKARLTPENWHRYLITRYSGERFPNVRVE